MGLLQDRTIDRMGMSIPCLVAAHASQSLEELLPSALHVVDLVEIPSGLRRIDLVAAPKMAFQDSSIENIVVLKCLHTSFVFRKAVRLRQGM